MGTRLWTGAAVTAALLLGMAAQAAAAGLDDLELGELWMGEAWSKETLRERTVVVEFWGYNCPPCRASLPHLAELADEHRDKGVVVIGVHSQNVPKEQVLDLCRAKGVNFSIYGSGKIKGCSFRGIPKVYLIDWKGEVCWDGHPSSLDAALDDALRGAPDWLAGPRHYEKVASEARKVRSRRGMGKAAASLREKTGSDDALEKEEAAELLGRLEKHAENRRRRAEALREEGRPLEALAVLEELSRAFRGDDIGEAAEARRKELEKDDAFQRERAAGKMLAAVEAMARRVDPPRRGEDLAKWKRKNGAVLMRLAGMLRSVEKKYGGTKVAGRIAGLRARLHLE